MFLRGNGNVPLTINITSADLTRIAADQDTLARNAIASVAALQNLTAAINRLTTVVDNGQAGIDAALAKLIVILTPPNKFRILTGGKPTMGINIIHDADHETLSIQVVDAAGQPAGPLDPSVVVTWAIVTDPNPIPSVTLTPNPDNQTVVMKQTGQLAIGVVISATATLSGATAPETEQASFNVVGGPGTSFVIEVSAETAN